MPKNKLKKPYKQNIELALLQSMFAVLEQYKSVYGVEQTCRVVTNHLQGLLTVKLF